MIANNMTNQEAHELRLETERLRNQVAELTSERDTYHAALLKVLHPAPFVSFEHLAQALGRCKTTGWGFHEFHAMGFVIRFMNQLQEVTRELNEAAKAVGATDDSR